MRRKSGPKHTQVFKHDGKTTLCSLGPVKLMCSVTLNCGAASSLRWYWLRRCRCSVSLTSSLTACSIPRQQAWARWSEGRSDEAAEGGKRNKLRYVLEILNLISLTNSRWTLLTLCVFHDVVQQQRVLGESLHLRHQQVFELQPAAVRTRLTLLHTEGQTYEGVWKYRLYGS